MKIRSTNTQLPIIHLLRGIAALMVAIFHFTGWADYQGGFYQESDLLARIGSHGKMGVYVFFVISGFVITYSLMVNQYKIKAFGRFILKRSIRIEIPYIVSILLVFLMKYLNHKFFAFPFEFKIKQTLLHLFYLVPFTKETWLSSVYWTLGIEFQFYLIIGMMAAVLMSRYTWLSVVLLLLFTSVNLFDLYKPDVWFIYSHTALFTLGIALALYLLNRIQWYQFLLLVVYSFIISWHVKGFEISFVGGLTCLTIFIFRFKKVWGKWWGNISYSLYLTHFLIGNFLIYYLLKVLDTGISKHLILLISLASSILFAWVFYRLVERPSQQLASKIIMNKVRTKGL